MFKHLSLSCLLLTTITATSALAAPKVTAGNVSNVVPDAFKSAQSCADDAEWKPVKFHQKFKPQDCFKTKDGGSVTLMLKGDNSTLTIGENSLISIDSLVDCYMVERLTITLGTIITYIIFLRLGTERQKQ